MTTATDKLKALWFQMKQEGEGNEVDYVDEMLSQIGLLSMSTKQTTKTWIIAHLKDLVASLEDTTRR